MTKVRFFAFLIIIIALGAASLHAEDCAVNLQDPANGLTFSAGPGASERVRIANPIAASVAAAKEAAPTATVTATDVVLCWISELDVRHGETCAEAAPATEGPFEIGVCNMQGTIPEIAQLGFDVTKIATAPVLVLDYEPKVTSATTSHLRMEWKVNVQPPTPDGEETAPDPTITDGAEVLKLTGTAAAPRFDEDSRYKLWLYTGYSYFRSANDFRDGYPELRARFETRLVDERIAMQKRHVSEYAQIEESGKRCYVVNSTRDCSYRPWFKIARLYGEVGLTGVDVRATADGGTEPIGSTRQTFDGAFAIGVGRTLLVTPMRRNDTDAFSFQGLARIGVLTIPGKDEVLNTDGTVKEAAVSGAQAYSYSLGGRIENEGGFFQGAYFELGAGQSQKFTLKQVPRLRSDALLPINPPGNFYRLAARLQVDLPRPFASAKGTGTTRGKNLEGEIRISLLLNIDMMELARRLGGNPRTTEP